jgi:ATP adenylyltransferase
MDQLWTPWRYQYVTTAEKAVRAGVPASLNAWPGDLGCVFCNLVASVDYAIAHGTSADTAEQAAGLVVRGAGCFLCLNTFPYNSGHVMVIPYEHQASLAALPASTAHELMDMAQETERVLTQLYTPHGINFGMNLGQAAGAGVAGHLHLHAVPRWVGDTNFMTVVAETRVLPESLEITWERMRGAFAGLGLQKLSSS